VNFRFAPPKPWFLREDYADRHGSFLSHGGQWYFATNDRSHSGDASHEGSFRDTVLCYIHFRANGTMEPCAITAAGVNVHSLGGGTPVEAEEFFVLAAAGQPADGHDDKGGKEDSGNRKVDLRAEGGGDGFAVALAEGGSVRDPHLTDLPPAATLLLRVASTRGAVVEVHANRTGGSDRGELVGRCAVGPTAGGLAVFEDAALCALRLPASAAAAAAAGGSEIALELTARRAGKLEEEPWEHAGHAAARELLRLDSFRFV
jgi:hypothetical protein